VEMDNIMENAFDAKSISVAKILKSTNKG